MPTNGQNQGTTAKKSLVEKWSSFADNLAKILASISQLVAIPLSLLIVGYGKLREAELLLPRWSIVLGVVVFACIGAVLIASYFRRHKRNSWRLWHSALVITFGILTLSLAGVIWHLKPPEPAWHRIDVVKLLTHPKTMHDFPILVMLDELSGRNGLIPGGKTYKQLLESKTANAQLQEEWAGYFAPLIVPSTMPTTVSLRNGPNLNNGNASIGVIVIVWTHGDNADKAKAPREFGYKALQSSVGVHVRLHGSERASMFVFVYPWNETASRALPDRFADAVNVK